MPEFAIIGMGRFGRAVAHHLALEGQAVLAIDRDPARLELVAGEVDAVVVADTTDRESLAALRLERMGCVVVAMGSRATEASVLTTAMLREAGVPRIVARSFDQRHGRLLLAIGAHEVLNPEEESGRRLALHLAHPSIVDQFDLGDAQIAEVEAPESFVGESIAGLELRRRLGVTVLAIRRAGAVLADPRDDETLETGDVLVLLGNSQAVKEISSLL